MADNLTDEQIDKIAQAIAAKMAKPGGPALLGCGSSSSSGQYDCSSTYECKGSTYFCGGPGEFRCAQFNCDKDFNCGGGNFDCYYSFNCVSTYSG